MATKPSTVPTFNTGGDNNTAPSAGKRILGWLVGEQPPSSYFNWLMKLYGEWLQYLSDGAFTGAASFANAVTMAQTLAVTGATTLTGALTAAAATFSGLVTANAGVLVPSGQTLDVNGVADLNGATALKLPPRVLLLPPALGSQGAGTVTCGDNGTATWGANASSWLLPIPLHVGDRITGITVYYSRDSAGTVSFALREKGATGGSTALVTKDISSGSGNSSTAIETSPTSGSLPQTLATANTYYLRIAADNTDDFYGAIVTYDRP